MPSQSDSFLSLCLQLQQTLTSLTQTRGQTISWIQYQYLALLHQQPLGTNALAQQLAVDKSSASRQLKQLAQQDLVTIQASARDGRARLAALTRQGQAHYLAYQAAMDARLGLVEAQLTPDEIHQQGQHLMRLQKAIRQSQLQQGYELRPIRKEDDTAIAAIIRQVSAEYGLSSDQGFGVADPNLDCLSGVYQANGSQYWVIVCDGEVLGGGGIAPLCGTRENDKICELQKMYFLPTLRGRGFARRLALHALAFAKSNGYLQCYLETTAKLTEAIALYHSLGFDPLDNAKGNTGHDACELPMLKHL
ncbi:bifunctional helix-turn-helix transcriptional regulator/GNAT family N-acetyltransferase [Shewanella sp. NIFS-20-20]|uniref:bifunctional helix-turn-helix transcriptional regulator/GNAT family N-acetyltransferase n=1 Tax=Shewanella sp. NIFS-20-20 TaxID=2853806 RepID=UPI001C461798|nr:bifunctional helix-turn-helix transcriptional regulator/GNAT family N-acetyltransferase [Shewanella sp. NIFS-20-20]MBV7316988.1 bifunctional helix-turn-helix transcriptional regulator/GNAT family N-acetyltransferase [Shewanella sp. NIFS-20-20]